MNNQGSQTVHEIIKEVSDLMDSGFEIDKQLLKRRIYETSPEYLRKQKHIMKKQETKRLEAVIKRTKGI